jgi:hypothetical protein
VLLLVLGVLALPCLAALGAGAYLWLRKPADPRRVEGDPTAEARVNVLNLCGDVQAYRDEHGTYLVAGPTPREVPRGGEAAPFPHDEAFERIGFNPGPEVRYQYEVMVQADPVGEPEVTCFARGDLDGDGQLSVFRVTLDVNGMTSPVQAERPEE